MYEGWVKLSARTSFAWTSSGLDAQTLFSGHILCHHPSRSAKNPGNKKCGPREPRVFRVKTVEEAWAPDEQRVERNLRCLRPSRNLRQDAKQNAEPAGNLAGASQIGPPHSIRQIVRHKSGGHVRVHNVRKPNRNDRNCKENPRQFHSA